MQRIALTLTATLSILLFGLASGCVNDDTEPPASHDQLAELVAANAQLDDWQICASEGADDVDAPSCPDAGVSDVPAAAASELLEPELGPEDSTRLIECGEGCCSFTGPSTTICCSVEHGPAQCTSY